MTRVDRLRFTDVATAGGSSGSPPMPEPFDRDAAIKVLEWFDQKDYLCARCANWTTYCDYCKARSRLRAKARQRALKQLQRRAAVIATTEAEVLAALAQPRPFYAELTQ